MRRRDFVRASALASAAALLGSRTARAVGETINEREPVDLELVLAVDVSASISEQELGRRRTPPDGFYRDWVIGGPGAFMVVAEGFGSFAAAIRRKLIREIAAAEPGAPIVERVRSA